MIDILWDKIYYTQMTPYEIRIYTLDGVLLSKVFRKNSFMSAPTFKITQDGSFTTAPFTGSFSMVVLKDGSGFLNVAKTPRLNTNGSRETIIDLFDREGHLLKTLRTKKDINIRCADTFGRVYGVDTEGPPMIVRYKIATDSESRQR